MKIVLIGATSFVGSAILKEALERGHEMTSVTRDREKLPSHAALHAHQVDVYDPDQLAQLIRGHDVVISAFNPGWNKPISTICSSKAPESLSMGSRKPA